MEPGCAAACGAYDQNERWREADSGHMSLDRVQALVDEIAETLRRAVVVDDTQLRLLYASRHYGDEDGQRVRSVLQRQIGPDALQHILSQGARVWTGPTRLPPKLDVGMESRWCVPVRHAGHLIGLMVVIDAQQTLTRSEKGLIEAAAGQIGAALYAESEDNQETSSLEVDLDDILDVSEDVRRTAIACMAGVPWLTDGSEVRCFAIRVVSSSAGSEAPRRALRAALGTRPGIAPQHYVFSTSDDGARVIEKVPFAGRAGPAQHSVEAMLSVADALLGGDRTCVVGVGDSADGLSDAWRSYRQAAIAADAATRSRRFGPIVAWSELGAYSVLLQSPAVNEPLILPAALEALVDPGQPSWMRETLLAYLDSSGSGPRAAEHLHIHRTTLYYRMDRIREALQMDLEDGENRLLLHASLRMLDVSRSSP
ncbi:hypothetical protein ASG56_06115 [Rhodococcus sp. Leaf7]|nr:hypothetical protein ASG56_06115 [Rhodococcus sp. Leaf7]KQU42637.1 hypothetical protein ASG64_06115 [Rhodococcus sp. Leaf247]